MRILYASERPPYPFFLGGAARCAHQLLSRLACMDDVDCLAVGSATFNNSVWSYPADSEYQALEVRSIGVEERLPSIDCGYNVRVLENFYVELDLLIERFQPDIVWTQLEGSKAIVELSSARKVRNLHFVHDAEFDARELKAIARYGAEFVSSSEFLAEKVGSAIRRKPHVIYPCPLTSFGVVADPNGYITMINPHRVKGVETFFEIAKLLPAQRFLLLESWKLQSLEKDKLITRLKSFPNVEFRERVSEMAEVYRQTKLLLIPSVWEEGFGMVAVEAESCGIPVIASNRGGLPEAVGSGGYIIDDYINAKVWVDKIERILFDSANYSDFKQRALRHANSEQFSSDYSAKRFNSVCSDMLQKRRPFIGFRDSFGYFLQRILLRSS